ncbi:MAG: peptide deformylase [Verrucomicrobia bacterium]|nr:peptide deformylase [Verrucomicrobiota bacterium]
MSIEYRWPVVYYGHPALRKRAEEVQEIDAEVRALAEEMLASLIHRRAVGLAAVQVNVNIRLFVVRVDDYHRDGSVIPGKPLVYINPVIKKTSQETEIMEEGCISIPGIRVPIERPKEIVIEATDLEGNRFEEALEGYEARARLHENDHLNGVLTIDRTPKRIRKRIEPQLRALKKKYSS